MAMFQALVVLAMASTVLGSDDFIVECETGDEFSGDSAHYAMHHTAIEVEEVGYKKQVMSGAMYNVGRIIGGLSYLVQFVNVVNDGVKEVKARIAEEPGQHVPFSKRAAAFLIDPNLISFCSSGLSFIVLQDFYARLYRGNPMGVWTVTAESHDENGDLECRRYGVIADDAEAAMQLGKCHQFPTHVPGCQEEYLSHKKNVLGWGKCNQDDPVIVQQTLFGGWSATGLQYAFLLGCVLRFFDAVTTFLFDWMSDGLFGYCNFGIFQLYYWVQKAALEFAMLRGYKKEDIGGFDELEEDRKGVYDPKNWQTCCCKCVDTDNLPSMLQMLDDWTKLPQMIKKMDWVAKVVSNVASDCLFAVLTMTSLHVSVEDGCISMNTEMGFSSLTVWVNIFIFVVGLVFSIIIWIVVYHMLEALYEWWTKTEYPDTACYFRVFAWCCYILAVFSIVGFWVNVFSLVLDGDLSAKGCAGIMLEIFGMVGEIAEGYQDEKEKAAGSRISNTQNTAESGNSNTRSSENTPIGNSRL